MRPTPQMLTGQSTDHLQKFAQHFPNLRPEHWLHQDIVSDFHSLKKSALEDGFNIAIVSSFRSFEAQKTIWNEKALGKRALLDEDETPLDYEQLEPYQVLRAILRWSAIPGASRHHWGTDLDIIDYAAIKDSDYQVSLTNSETQRGGPFEKFHEWLDKKIERNESFSFYRPYTLDHGGVSPERWHLSHDRTSKIFKQEYSLEFFRTHIIQSDFELKEELLSELDATFENYISTTTAPPWE